MVLLLVLCRCMNLATVSVCLMRLCTGWMPAQMPRYVHLPASLQWQHICAAPACMLKTRFKRAWHNRAGDTGMCNMHLPDCRMLASCCSLVNNSRAHRQTQHLHLMLCSSLIIQYSHVSCCCSCAAAHFTNGPWCDGGHLLRPPRHHGLLQGRLQPAQPHPQRLGPST
jgi:hypothetical protein